MPRRHTARCVREQTQDEEEHGRSRPFRRGARGAAGRAARRPGAARVMVFAPLLISVEHAGGVRVVGVAGGGDPPPAPAPPAPPPGRRAPPPGPLRGPARTALLHRAGPPILLAARAGQRAPRPRAP